MSMQKFEETTPRDVVWNMEKLIPESPKKDGSVEAHLRKIGKTPKDYICTTLVATTINTGDNCSVCAQTEKTTRLCRRIQKDTVQDIPLCIDCINAFVEYNPESVYDLTSKEINTQ